MRRFLAPALIASLMTFSTVGLVGCGETEGTKTTTETTTPGGGKIKETDSTKVEKTGDAKDTAAPKTTP